MTLALPRRIDGYIRVSRVGVRHGERFISPSVQREEIETWAARCGFEVQQVFEELDESGGRADRPLLETAIRRIEAGLSSGLAVSRVDRFGRSLRDGVLTMERVRAAGGGFYSVNDGLDSSTEAGRLVMHILLSVAEYDLDRMRAGWEVARSRAINRGVYPGGIVPVGYRKTRSGRLRPDPKKAPHITEGFRRRADGETLRSVCEYLEAERVCTATGRPIWPVPVVARTLKGRIYLGELRSGRHVFTHAHAALVDPATWEAAQRPQRPASRPRCAHPALLTGLVRCASCSHTLTPVYYSPHGQRTMHYRCRKHHSAGRCPAPSGMVASLLEPFILDAALRLLGLRRAPPLEQLAAEKSKAQAAATALTRYRDNDRLAVRLGESRFIEGLTVRCERLRRANLQLADAQARVTVHDLPSVDRVRDALDGMNMIERRELIARVIDTSFVGPGTGRPRTRVTICPAGTGPADLTRQGAPSGPNRAIKPRRCWINPRH